MKENFMQNSSLIQFLEEIITLNLTKDSDSIEETSGLDINSNSGDEPNKFNDKELNVGSLKVQGRKIAEDLIKQAIASGLDLTATRVTDKSLKGGNTAEFVGELTLSAPFVFKMDKESKKLAEEGLAIQKIKNNGNLSKRFRDAWPFVYAIRSESPYAYLMEFFRPEEGWLSLEDRLYSKEDKDSMNEPRASRLINSILDILFEGYEDSINTRQYPNIKEDYVQRIKERLMESEKLDNRFASKPININGKSYKPWKEYIEIIENRPSYLSLITPPFISVVHGDPNPGNLLLKVTSTDIFLKLIDPKEWITGDYLFDICKITHFIEATGPVEKPISGMEVKAQFYVNNLENILLYSINKPKWTETIIAACRDRLTGFALDFGDLYWDQRYELGMSANLLGLPIGRLKKGNVDSALILYGEGIKWLDKFCENFQNINS